MTSKYLQMFVESMRPSYEQWHHGLGYDLAALKATPMAERQDVEELLVSRPAADWRDIEALDCLGTQGALLHMERALTSKELTTRAEAVERLCARSRLDDNRVEVIILESLDAMTLLNGMTRVLDLAKRYPSLSVRRKGLSKALKGREDIRVHAAALAHHLYGGTSHPFDLDHRPLHIRFNSHNRREREIAFCELCSLIGENPSDVLERPFAEPNR